VLLLLPCFCRDCNVCLMACNVDRGDCDSESESPLTAEVLPSVDTIKLCIIIVVLVVIVIVVIIIISPHYMLTNA